MRRWRLRMRFGVTLRERTEARSRLLPAPAVSFVFLLFLALSSSLSRQQQSRPWPSFPMPFKGKLVGGGPVPELPERLISVRGRDHDVGASGDRAGVVIGDGNGLRAWSDEGESECMGAGISSSEHVERREIRGGVGGSEMNGTV